MLQKDFHVIFLEQDFENEFFDVIFYVEGEELYAHRGILASASDVFEQLFIKNRSTPNQSVQINGYSYDEFFEFLDAIYDMNEKILLYKSDHIFAVMELAHCYKINAIKEECVQYLVNHLPTYDAQDSFKAMEAIHKYTFMKFNEEIQEFIRERLDDLIQFDGFVNLGKSAIQAFVIFARNVDKSEELCKAICQWGEHQAMITVEISEEEKNDLILHQINDILPFFTFNSLLKVFVNQKGLISVNEAKKVKTIQVNVKSGDKSVTGSFVDSYGIFELIKSLGNTRLFNCYGVKERMFWGKIFDVPSIPSLIQKRDNIQWYLLFNDDGYLCIRHQSKIEETDYLIAEMKASNENEFGEDEEFTIEEDVRVFATVSRKYEQLF